MEQVFICFDLEMFANLKRMKAALLKESNLERKVAAIVCECASGATYHIIPHILGLVKMTTVTTDDL